MLVSFGASFGASWNETHFEKQFYGPRASQLQLRTVTTPSSSLSPVLLKKDTHAEITPRGSFLVFRLRFPRHVQDLTPKESFYIKTNWTSFPVLTTCLDTF